MKKTAVLSTLLITSLCLNVQALSDKESQRLLSFCEVYSTVKYYYPEPNLHGFPWDGFAYQGYKLATTSKSDKEFVQGMDNLFQRIAPGVQVSKKKFDLTRITPKDTLLYQERAFWQHQSGLNVDVASFANASTLNYIYGKSTSEYQLIQMIAAKPKGLLGRKLRISLMAKIEGNTDSVEVFSFNTALGAARGSSTTTINTSDIRTMRSGVGKVDLRIGIKAAGNEWRRYIVEFEHPENVIFSRLAIYHPKKGAVCVDDLRLERFENGGWEEVEIANAGFEGYASSGNVGFWEKMYVFGNLEIADSINAVEGKYCLKLPKVEDKLLYPPVPMDKPYAVLLPNGYRAYIPLQLYADENTVFPATQKQIIEKLAKEHQSYSSSNRALAIACAMQVWAALYQDYPYRESDFESKLNQLLIKTIIKLEDPETEDFFTTLANDFLVWINDPHLRLDGKFSTNSTALRLPTQSPNDIELTENQCVVGNVPDGETRLQMGDVLLQINGISIDSVLHMYETHNISRLNRYLAMRRLLKTDGEPEAKVRVLRNGVTIDMVFSSKTEQQGERISLQGERGKYQALQDSLKKAKDVFYLNALYPPVAFGSALVRSTENTLNRYRATDSLVIALNKHKALILDVRGRPTGSVLSFLKDCMGIASDRNMDIIKTAFYPIAQFKRDTLDYMLSNQRKDVIIRVPVYVLIDYNTMSAPERSLLDLKSSGKAVFVGSNTSGAAGPVCKTEIADKITLTYTTGQFVGIDNNPMSYQGTGLKPDIYVYPTPQGVAEGRDEVLEKAIEMALENAQKNG